MLIKCTNSCGRGCSHCSEDSTRAGEHMTDEIFRAALDFSERLEAATWQVGCPPLMLLSGGECTEHPRIEWMIQTCLDRKYIPILITNGMWLADEALRSSLLRKEWPIMVQVTYDSRYYPPPAPVRIDDPRITYVYSLSRLFPLGRLKKSQEHTVPYRSAPTSFNLRSVTRSMGSFAKALMLQRVRAATGLSGHCSPSICEDGRVNVGESRNCWTIGTVYSTEAELTQAVLQMKSCNRCGLEDKLHGQYRTALGLDE